jgi:MFS family permease
MADAFATPDLRRVQLAWSVSAVGSWIVFVALAVYAYDAGGAAAVGLAALVRMVPAGLAAPLAGVLADRLPRRDVLLGSLAARSATMAAVVAAVATGAPAGVVFALAALFTIEASAHKPAQAALLPALVQTPRQLAACNAIWSGVDNAAFLAGSVAGGALIALASVEAAFGLTAVLFAAAAIPVARIARDPIPAYRAGDDHAHPLQGALAGFRAVAADADLRLIAGFLTAATLVEGAADVLVVVVAIELLDLGGAGVGWLNACWGAGGLIGGIAALTLLRRGRLAAGLAAGGLLVGLPLMATAVLASPWVAAALLVLLGVGYGLIEVAGLSLMQRLSSEETLGRAFAVVESSYWLSTGLGAVLAPVVVALLGLSGALIAVGACLPLIVALRWAALMRLEAGAAVPEREFRALRALSVFDPLPIAAVENVARRVTEVRAAAGEVVIREGDRADRFYVVADGWADVGRGGEALARRGPGDFFGEVALLRDMPRTATVTARGDVVLYALERDAFLFALGAHPRSRDAVSRVAETRLATVRPTPAPARSIQ